MKKNIKLTEADLARIVKRVIREQSNDVASSMTSTKIPKKFNKLVKSKLGNSKPLVEQEYDMDKLDSKELREKFESLIVRFEEIADELKEIFNEIHEFDNQLDGIEDKELENDIARGLSYIDDTMKELWYNVYQ